MRTGARRWPRARAKPNRELSRWGRSVAAAAAHAMRASGAKVVAMRLVADTMLGRLAKWLRVLGYDTLYWRGDDEGLLLVARREGRLVLTRDTRLPSRLPPGQTLFIDSDYYDEQLRQVVARLGRPSQQGHRCLRCNLLLESVDRAEVRGQVPEYVWARHARFARCAGCRRIYWEGTHVQRMAETLQRLCG